MIVATIATQAFSLIVIGGVDITSRTLTSAIVCVFISSPPFLPVVLIGHQVFSRVALKFFFTHGTTKIVSLALVDTFPFGFLFVDFHIADGVL